jgi:hypothetical protein
MITRMNIKWEIMKNSLVFDLNLNLKPDLKVGAKDKDKDIDIDKENYNIYREKLKN